MDEDRAEAAGVADFLRLVSAIHRQDSGDRVAETLALGHATTDQLVWMLECAARAHLAALYVLYGGDGQLVSAALDTAAMSALDRLRDDPDV